MKHIFLFVSLAVSMSVFAAEIQSDFIVRNSYSGDTNQGECGIVFEVETKGYIEPEIREIEFYATLKDAQGKSLDHIVEKANKFEYVGGKSFFNIVLEGLEACKAMGNTVVFNKVLVNFNDGSRPKDIVKSKQLKVNKFKPVKIVISP